MPAWFRAAIIISRLGISKEGVLCREPLLAVPAVQMRSLHSPRYRRFARRLREARESARLTQADSARVLGQPQSFIAKVEAGQRRVDVVELQDLAKLYRKPIAYFLK